MKNFTKRLSVSTAAIGLAAGTALAAAPSAAAQEAVPAEEAPANPIEPVIASMELLPDEVAIPIGGSAVLSVLTMVNLPNLLPVQE